MKTYIKKMPILGPLATRFYSSLATLLKPFRGSREYWIERYRSGGNSGPGSYDNLAKFKAEVLNNFVGEYSIDRIIEYGCGDGNQLRLSEYPSYIGFDVSPTAISLCKAIFREDHAKTFKLMDDYQGETAQLTVSLDVIYHLVEDEVFFRSMERPFDSSQKFVIIYSSNIDDQNHYAQSRPAAYIKHRRFSRWIEENGPQWRPHQYIPNRYPYKANPVEGSWADFYIYKQIG